MIKNIWLAKLLFRLYNNKFIINAVSYISVEKNKINLFKGSLFYKEVNIIPGCIDIENFKQKLYKTDEYNKRFNIDMNTILIGTVGRLHYSKGFDVLIKAVKFINDNYNLSLLFMIAGEGPERKKLENMIQKNKLQDSIQLLGNLNNITQFLYSLDSFFYYQKSLFAPFLNLWILNQN